MSKPGSDFWNARFAASTYVFGTEPAVFLQEQLQHLPPGSRVLVPADGEGRNSVHLAQAGHRVVATDIAEQGINKARALAADAKVSVEFRHVDLLSWDWPEAAFDAVVAIFIQFAPAAQQATLFEGIKRAVRPGGLVLLHGYTPKQLEYGTGGPPAAGNMYTEALLGQHFAGWELLRLQSYERVLDEGPGHSGQSALIDLVARRPR